MSEVRWLVLTEAGVLLFSIVIAFTVAAIVDGNATRRSIDSEGRAILACLTGVVVTYVFSAVLRFLP